VIHNIRKFLRFAYIYGLSRAIIKTLGRKRNLALVKFPFLTSRKKNIGFAGCGQFAFSTLAYFIARKKGNRFLGCFDIDPRQADSLARFYRMPHAFSSFRNLLNAEGLELLYISSNHASHTPYAIEALNRQVDVYTEKPVSVNKEQFSKLIKTIRKSNARIWAGYNRPFSGAIQRITGSIKNCRQPISLGCFVSGHKIPEDHWYRNPGEGTRICGNAGHWLDLMIHLFAARGNTPETFDVTIDYSNQNEPDDNLAMNITTEMHDLVSIVITSRTEPFEGINETINIQCGDLIAKIDDFRSLTLWQDSKKIKKRYRPKDVGHKNAVLQPFNKAQRNWEEVELSTLLMLDIAEMVQSKEKSRKIRLKEELKNMMHETNHSGS
jgi:predicted dehydrogenase